MPKDPTFLLMCLNMILVMDETSQPTREMIRQCMFAYGIQPAEVAEEELRIRGILERDICQ